MSKLILLRHGASVWNEKNLFTGWVDVPLSSRGIVEAQEAGKKIASIPIDLIYTSCLSRALTTALIAMSVHQGEKTPYVYHKTPFYKKDRSKIYSLKTSCESLPLIQAAELNERMYGELQGQNKKEAAQMFGEEQVHIWRRSYDVPPPKGESLEMTANRVIPYFEKKILPEAKSGKNIFICAHGNSLRSLVMFLENLSKEQVVNLEIPTGDPFLYNLAEGKWVRDDLLR